MDIECTQRLECTQELYNTQTEKKDPEQIGYLGICGGKYSVKRGPNKIGRDPKTCGIVLNLNSISRQHAVINVLNLNESMLMDLDSANRTKVQGKSLQPYIPHPLKNGDMVQFGDVFGVFRLLEEDNDLPMTQALDLPCTPAPVCKQMPRLAMPSVLVPESPEVSDKDDSFIMPSQPKKSSEFKSPFNKFIKTSNKTIAIQPIGSKKIDNAYWRSGKKSESFNFQLDDSGSSLNDSTTSNNSDKVIDESIDNIYEMETQEPSKGNESTDSIYTANTQRPPSPSIHSMETQQPVPDIYGLDTQQPIDIHAINTQHVPENIHNCHTQVSTSEHLPEVCKINQQKDVQLDLFTDGKENDVSIFNAETQVFPAEKEAALAEPKEPEQQNKNESDEEILFDEIGTQSFHDALDSQPLLPAEISPNIDRIEKIEVSSKNIKLGSDDLSDCEDFDILPTQKITTSIDTLPTQNITNAVNMLPTQKIMDDIDILPTQKITNDDDDLTDCEDDFVNNVPAKPEGIPEINFEDMATQVLGDNEIEMELTKNKDQTDGPAKEITFEDMPTQVITDDDKKDDKFEDMPTQIITEGENDCVKASDQEVFSEKIVSSPFKIPLPSPLNSKKTSRLALTKVSTPKPAEVKNIDDDDPNYYAATQDIFNDLCSQRDPSSETDKQDSSKPNEPLNVDEIVPCSVEDYKVGDAFRHIDNDLSPVNHNAKGPNTKQVVNAKSSITSANDVTVKTPQTLKIINADLPDSQEIKTSVTYKHKSMTESSSESEVEEVSDQESGITFGRKKRSKANAKTNLTKRFEELPTRIITRVRKPTFKVRNSDETTKRQCKSILSNPFLVDSEDSIDAEIVNDNISRMKTHAKRKRDRSSGNSSKRQSDEPKRPESRNKNKKADMSPEITTKSNDSGSRSSRSKSKKSNEVQSKAESKDEKSIRSTRSTRNKKDSKKDDKSKSDRNNKRKSKENDRSDSKSKNRTRNHSNETKSTRDTSRSKEKDKTFDNPETSPEIEVRRSNRQRSKDNNKGRAIHENSTVYCLSSESNTESPKTLKRPASNDLEVPSPKRTRSLPNSKTSSVCTTPNNAPVCSTPARADVQYVLFTAFSNEDVRSKLEALGAVIVTDVMACTVLVTLQIKRTFKLLCAVGLGKPIVGPDWVQACADTKSIVDPWQYIIKDEPAEKRFHFSLEKTLRGKRDFLKGFHVSSTASVLPNAQEMKLIVECSGGTWGSGPNWVCVSSSADKSQWPALRRRGATVVSTEFILGGVLRQHADAAAAALGVAIKKKGEGEFVCAECGRRCLSRIGLASHARAHTNS